MPRSAVIDTIKAVASQVIVWHHLSVYAPMTDWLELEWPRLVDLIYVDGRLAVQCFLVVGGFLAVQSLARQPHGSAVRMIWKRYLRLAPPLLMALFLVMLATLWMRPVLFTQDWLSPLPTPGVVLAHVFLLQDLLNIPSLSAGAWYVSIDLQLFALSVCLVQLAARSQPAIECSWAPSVMAGATVASSVWFSRVPELEAWGFFFLSAYGLGSLAAWAQTSARARRFLVLTSVLLLADWWIDPRARTLLSLATAWSLWAWSNLSWPERRSGLRRVFEFLSDYAYGIFLSHFAIIIVFSGLWEGQFLDGMNAAVAWIILAWLSAIAAGVLLQTLVERAMHVARAAKARSPG
jgi:peptidoglycan/LPS O-acetylase OafA/YrhL